jgi:hypothetical protein
MQDSEIEFLNTELKYENSENIKIIEQCQDVENELNEKIMDYRVKYAQFNIFKKILDERDIGDYDKLTNNCYQQSQDIQKKLKKIGIESSIAVNEDRSHAWLLVWVEATDGTFIVPGDKKIYEIRDYKLDVICD